MGWSPSPSHLHAPGSGGLAIPASGEVDTGQLSGMPSEQPAMGGRYTLPAGMRNSVTSVIHSSLGSSAWKRCLPRSSRSRFSGASEISPSYEL